MCTDRVPVSAVLSRSGGEELAYGYCSTPGWNDKMEDTVSVTTPLDEDDDHTGLFAVFDGHAGTHTPRDLIVRSRKVILLLMCSLRQVRPRRSLRPTVCGTRCRRQ